MRAEGVLGTYLEVIWEAALIMGLNGQKKSHLESQSDVYGQTNYSHTMLPAFMVGFFLHNDEKDYRNLTLLVAAYAKI